MTATNGGPAELRARVAAEPRPARRAELLLDLAQALETVDLAEAMTASRQAVDLARTAALPLHVARALSRVARLSCAQGELSAAADFSREALEIAVSADDSAVLWDAAEVLGLASRQRGDCRQAIRWLEQYLQTAQAVAQSTNPAAPQAGAAVATVSHHLGSLLRECGEPERALALARNALAWFEKGKDGRLSGQTHVAVGLTYGDLGDWEKAIEHFYRALVEFERIQDWLGMAASHTSIAEIYLKRGKFERAVHSAQLAAGYAEQGGLASCRLAALGLLGEACELAGDLARARDIYDRNIASARESGMPLEEALTLQRKAEMLLRQSDPAPYRSPGSDGVDVHWPIGRPTEAAPVTEAREMLNRALSLLDKAPSEVARAGVLRTLGRAVALAGEPALARTHFESSVTILRERHRSYELARASFDFGRFLVGSGDRVLGLQLVREAAQTFRRLEVISNSETAEHYLLGMASDQDRRLSALRALSALTARSLPLAEFAPRCVDILKNALGFTTAAFNVHQGRAFHYGDGACLEEADICRKDELVVNRDLVCLPLRLAGESIGSVLLRWNQPNDMNVDSPFLEIVSNLLSVAMERTRAQPEPGDSRKPAAGRSPTEDLTYPGFVGRSAPMQAIFRTIEQVAPTGACILIQGDSGTGKELVARLIRDRSPRCSKPFVPFNCAAIPESLVEAELFGIEKGIATGVTERRGKFEQAHGGTLFLDEIGDMSPIVQTKLLRVLQEHKVERVGGRRLIDIDTRIIAATNRNLEQAVRDGRFRSDLFYRLNVICITLPPLSERRDDIGPMVTHFIAQYNDEFQRRIRDAAPDVLDIFSRYAWSGNVRELKNVIERAVILCRGDLIQVEDLPPALQQLRRSPAPGPASVSSLTDLRDLRRQTQDEVAATVEKDLIETALRETDWNAAEAARRLGISRSHFYRLLDKYGLKRADVP